MGLCSSVMGLCSSKDEKNGADTVRSHLVRCEKSTYYIAFLRGGIFFPSISRGQIDELLALLLDAPPADYHASCRTLADRSAQPLGRGHRVGPGTRILRSTDRPADFPNHVRGNLVILH